LRFCIWPERAVAPAKSPKTTGELTGPQVAVPTMPMMFDGAPGRAPAGGAWT
jgi:hypothetical protein